MHVESLMNISIVSAESHILNKQQLDRFWRKTIETGLAE
jgi:hypothetical protein